VGPPQIAQLVWQIAEPLAAQGGYEVVDVEYRPERGRMVLRVFVDREGGVTLDELTQLSRELGDLIEVRDVIATAYTLELSSPGINRPLTRPEHFPRFIGQRVRVRTMTEIDGRRHFLGTLVAADALGIALRLCDETEVRIAFRVVVRANYEHDFDAGKPTRHARGGANRPTAPRRRA
jgi:ribosome maturation factor RimP